MGDLAHFQAKFREAVHSGELSGELEGKIVSDTLSPVSRMQVYQNNYVVTLVDLFQGIFPLVTAFVGEEFLRAAAKHFLEGNPPTDPRLNTFGSEFPDFLRSYPHAADVIYIADIAALEWAVHELQHVRAVEEGAAMQPSQAEGYMLNPNFRIIESEYPLLQLWMVGNGQLVPEAVHIDAGGQTVAVCLDQFEVKLQVLERAEHKCLAWLCGKAEQPNDGTGELLGSLSSKNIILQS